MSSLCYQDGAMYEQQPSMGMIRKKYREELLKDFKLGLDMINPDPDPSCFSHASYGVAVPYHTPDNDIFLDPDTMTYKSSAQSLEIKELNRKLEEKEKEREKSLESIIGYFYKENRG